MIFIIFGAEIDKMRKRGFKTLNLILELSNRIKVLDWNKITTNKLGNCLFIIPLVRSNNVGVETDMEVI